MDEQRVNKSTLKTEILELLEHECDLYDSPRAYRMYQAIQHSDSNTTMCRMLAMAFVQLDKNLKTITDELIDERLHSTRVIIK